MVVVDTMMVKWFVVEYFYDDDDAGGYGCGLWC